MVKSKDVEPCWCRGTISLDTGSNYKLHGLSTGFLHPEISAGILHPENSHVVQDKSICKNNSDVVLRILERDIPQPFECRLSENTYFALWFAVNLIYASQTKYEVCMIKTGMCNW